MEVQIRWWNHLFSLITSFPIHTLLKSSHIPLGFLVFFFFFLNHFLPFSNQPIKTEINPPKCLQKSPTSKTKSHVFLLFLSFQIFTTTACQHFCCHNHFSLLYSKRLLSTSTLILMGFILFCLWTKVSTFNKILVNGYRKKVYFVLVYKDEFGIN